MCAMAGVVRIVLGAALQTGMVERGRKVRGQKVGRRTGVEAIALCMEMEIGIVPDARQRGVERVN
jgi:hypothetical protein